MTAGYIRGLGRILHGGLEAMEIWVTKSHAGELPYSKNERIPIKLEIGGQEYNAGLRSTSKNTYVWICPDLRDDGGNRLLSLANALRNHGYNKNQKIKLEVDGNRIIIFPFNK